MSFNENRYTIEQLRGNTDFPRNSYPLLRSSKRRSDPVGITAAPSYPGLFGKKLKIEYSVGTTPTVREITFPSNDYAAALNQLNIADVSNIEAVDMDGFLTIRHKVAGGTNYLKILPQTDPALEAATLLGLATYPHYGSVSYAGELSTTPASRREGNPQGTALISRDEDFVASAFNRAILSCMNLMQANNIDLDREVSVVQEVQVILGNNPSVAAADGVPVGQQSTVVNVFSLQNSPHARIPLHFFNGIDPGAVALENLIKLIFANTRQELFLDSGNGGGRYRVRSLHYALDSSKGTLPFRTFNSTPLADWSSRSGQSIFCVGNKSIVDKHASVAITEIHPGNIIRCAGATFQTKMVEPGDTVLISGSANPYPFNHDGEYVVAFIYDEETIVVRRKSTLEPKIRTDIPDLNFPTELNMSGSEGFGSITIPIGNAIPSSHYYPTVGAGYRSHIVGTIEHVGGSSWGLTTAYAGQNVLALIKANVSMRTITAQQFSKDFNVPIDTVREAMDSIDLSPYDNHISSGGHGAANIVWTGPPVWTQTSEPLVGTQVDAIIRSIVGMLSAHSDDAAVKGGTHRIGGSSITAPVDPTPYVLSGGRLRDQLKELLQAINHHINDAAVHGGGGGGYVLPNYSGSPAWKDATTIAGGITLDAAIDRIVTDLAATAGAGRLGAAALNETLFGVGAPGSSIRSQLDYLSGNWAKLARANTFSATQTMNGGAGDAGVIVTTAIPSIRKLLWDAAAPAYHTRMYITASGVLEFTVNAKWNGSSWQYDYFSGSARASRLTLTADPAILELQSRYATSNTTWLEGNWTRDWISNTVVTPTPPPNPNALVKARGRSSTHPLTNSLTWGVSGTALDLSFKRLVVTLSVPFSIVLANGYSDGDGMRMVRNDAGLTGNKFGFMVTAITGGPTIDLSVINIDIDYICA